MNRAAIGFTDSILPAVVRTSTLRVMNARKVVAELILSDHPNDCLTCPKCGTQFIKKS